MQNQYIFFKRMILCARKHSIPLLCGKSNVGLTVGKQVLRTQGVRIAGNVEAQQRTAQSRIASLHFCLSTSVRLFETPCTESP